MDLRPGASRMNTLAALLDLGSKDDETSRKAAKALIEAGGSWVEWPVSRVMRRKETWMRSRQYAAAVLAQIGDEKAFDTFLTAISNDSSDGRRSAARALRQFHNPKALQKLTALLKHSSPALPAGNAPMVLYRPIRMYSADAY